MGKTSYPLVGMGIVAGKIFICGCEYGIVISDGYLPVAISRCGAAPGKRRMRKKRVLRSFFPVIINGLVLALVLGTKQKGIRLGSNV